MNKEIQEVILLKAIEHYGKNNQLVVCMEEFSELTKAICKALRGTINRDNLIEEIADAKIMLWQVQLMVNADRDIELMMRNKIARLERRMIGGE